MSARIVEVRNAVVTRINGAWTSRGSIDDAVSGPWRLDLDTKKVKGRQVYVFPSSYSGGPENRLEDENDYTLVVLVAEVYRGTGDPPDEWLDERALFCEWLANEVLGDPRAERLLAEPSDPGSGLWPESVEVTTVYDVDELVQKKLFLSVLTATFREQAA
jgi:hypothetical protein